MSLRSRSNKSYNRAEAKEEFYWLDLLFPEDDYHNCWYCCEECDSSWWYDTYYGGVANMDQYHKMKVLTLLRSFRIHAATEEAEERGW
jgi:hypothetical protein